METSGGETALLSVLDGEDGPVEIELGLEDGLEDGLENELEVVLLVRDVLGLQLHDS